MIASSGTSWSYFSKVAIKLNLEIKECNGWGSWWSVKGSPDIARGLLGLCLVRNLLYKVGGSLSLTEMEAYLN